MKIEIIVQFDGDDEQAEKAREIFDALVRSGGLWGVKGGKTILHFDANGVFQGVELDYWPWRKRTKDKDVPR